MGLVLFFFLLLPLPVQALTLQDLVDQGSFSAGGSTFSNFTASTHIATYSIGGGRCTFSTLEEIQVDLMPDGFLISNIYGSGQSDNGLHGMPSDFHLSLAFDSFPRPVRLTDVTLGGAWSPFTTVSLDETLSHPVTYHYTASLGIQISPHCSHTHFPLFPCDFSFHEGAVTVTTNVPEPSTEALMIAGVPGLAMIRYVGRTYRNRLWGAVCLVMVGFVPVHAHALSLQDLVDDGSSFSAGGATFSKFAASILVSSYSNVGSPTPLLPGVSVATLDDIQVEAKVEGFEVSNLFGFGQSLHGFAGLPYDFTRTGEAS